MTPGDASRIRQFNETLGEEVLLRLSLTDDPRSGRMELFCKDLNQLAPKIAVLPAENHTGRYPAILIGSGLVFHTVPANRELENFLAALTYSSTVGPAIDPHLVSSLEGSLPTDLQLYIAPACPFCPGVLREILPLPFTAPALRLTVTDGMLFPELAEQDEIKSVPTVILDETFRWTGQISLTDILDTLIDRDPAGLKRAALQRILLDEEGGAYRLAAAMNRQGVIFPAFYDLLLDETFTTRLAAMVAMETLVEENPVLARSALTALAERFDAAADAVKGDVLYILGEVKSSQSVPFIKAVLEGNYTAEVKECAREALEELQDES